jgi:UDP-glucose 4-epimerase
VLKLPNESVAALRPHLEGRVVCVTGGAGFIGGHLVDALVSLGCRIRIIDDLSNSSADHIAELIELDPDRVQFIRGSILDDGALAEAVAGTDIVFHLAAMSSVPRSIAEPERTYAVNATGTLRVAEAARKARCRRIIYSASSSAYGQSIHLPKVETDTPAPVSPYGASKLAGEHVMLAWAQSYGLSTLSLRYFNIFGPRQPADSPYSAVIAVFAKKLLSGEQPVIFGDGTQSRDFTFVANAVLANLQAAATDKPLAGDVVNIGSGTRTDLASLARAMAERCGAPHLGPRFEPARTGDVLHSQADISAARKLLGYSPVVSLEDGLSLTIDWHRGLCEACAPRES